MFVLKEELDVALLLLTGVFGQRAQMGMLMFGESRMSVM
jgi:hypothetical protein